MQPFVENTNILKSFRQPTEEFFKVFSILAAPLIVAFMAALFLWVPDQTREIYRVYARDLALEQRGGYFYGQIEFGLIGVLLTSVFNWQLARNLTLQFARSTLPEPNVRGFALRWLPRFCGALIPAGAAIGLLVASREVKAIPFNLMASLTTPKQEEASGILFTVGCVLMVCSVGLVLFAYLRSIGPRNKYATARKWFFSYWGISGFAVLTIASVVLFATPLVGERSVTLAQFLGTPAIFFLFIIQLTYYASLLSAVNSRYGMPVLPLIAVWALAIGWFDINDNHFVPVQRIPDQQAPVGLKEAFAKWYAARADLEFYQKAGKPYPVFLVSAAGGGLYAADFTATALGRLQDDCPAFAQHAFAVSGVSGGGFGASLFSTLVSQQAQIRSSDIAGADPCAARNASTGGLGFERRAKLYLNDDFLAPIAAAGLFPDFVQRFLPFPVPVLDRSRAFETNLDARWRNQNVGCEEGDCAPFARPFLEHWRADGVAPALVLNTTNVDIGYRTVIAPFIVAKDVPDEYSALQNFHAMMHGSDLSLGAAVGLTARFPWVMPPGSFNMPNGQAKLRLLHGGIFENSGVDTVADMLIDLQEFEIEPAKRTEASARQAPWVVFHPIVISGYQLNHLPTTSTLSGEAFSPISAMLGTRVQRAGMASYRLFLRRGYNCSLANQAERCSASGIRFLVLNHEDYRMPVGWQLSTFSRDIIEQHVGSADKCDPIPKIRDMFKGPSPEQRQQYTRRENNCTACAIMTALRSQPLLGSRQCK